MAFQCFMDFVVLSANGYGASVELLFGFSSAGYMAVGL